MILTMEPKNVFKFFEEICAIPHGSGNTAQITQYLCEFAKARGLKYRTDDAGNVVIKKAGSKGAAKAAPLILQAHIDMVCEKNSGVPIDMEKDPIKLKVDGDVISADGTTLGADDGIGCALILAALDDEKLTAPPLECIFTTDEETGMNGAETLDMSDLKGRRLVNLDSEEEGVFTVGCAGGALVTVHLGGEREALTGYILKISVSGLLGGHSGGMISLGRANANTILGRVLYRLYKKVKFHVVEISGGSKDNAIPRDARCEILFPEEEKEWKDTRKKIKKALIRAASEICAEYAVSDPGMEIEYNWDGVQSRSAFAKKSTKNLLGYLLTAPNGLIAMSPTFPGLPQTSLNLGVLRTVDTTDLIADDATEKAEKEDKKAVAGTGFEMTYLVRSSVNSQKRWLVEQLAVLAKKFGGLSVTLSEYPAWEYREDSPLRELCARVFEKTTGEKAQIRMTHGGLECGILSAKLEGLDCISMGPEMADVHTPDEHLSVASVQRTWEFVKSLLKESSKNK